MGISINYEQFFVMAKQLVGAENVSEETVDNKVDICCVFNHANKTKETEYGKEEILDQNELQTAMNGLKVQYNDIIAKGNKPQMGEIQCVQDGENYKFEAKTNVITQEIIDGIQNVADFDNYTIPDELKDKVQARKNQLTDKSSSWPESDRKAKVGYKDTTGRIGGSAWKNSISGLFGESEGKINLNNYTNASEVLDEILKTEGYKDVELTADGKAKLLQDFIHNNKSVFNTNGEIHTGADASRLELPTPENVAKAKYGEANKVKQEATPTPETPAGGENSIRGVKPKKTHNNWNTFVDERDEDNTAPRSRTFNSSSFTLDGKNKLSPEVRAEVIRLIKEGKITSYTRTIGGKTTTYPVEMRGGEPCMKSGNTWYIIGQRDDRSFADLGKTYYQNLEHQVHLQRGQQRYRVGAGLPEA